MVVHEGPVANLNRRQCTMNHCSRTNRFEQYKYIYRVGVSSRHRVLSGYKTSSVCDILPRGMY